MTWKWHLTDFLKICVKHTQSNYIKIMIFNHNGWISRKTTAKSHGKLPPTRYCAHSLVSKWQRRWWTRLQSMWVSLKNTNQPLLVCKSIITQIKHYLSGNPAFTGLEVRYSYIIRSSPKLSQREKCCWQIHEEQWGAPAYKDADFRLEARHTYSGCRKPAV